MKRLILLNAILAIVLLGSAQNGKSINDPNAQVRNVSGFHGIRISNGIDLYLSQGPEAVAVSASKVEYRDKIHTVVEDGILKIYLQNTGNITWNFHNPKLKAYVSISTISDLKASGGSDVYIDKVLKSDKLDMNLSGGSDFHGEVDIHTLSIDQSGGSDVDISGKVGNLTIDASGGSDFKGYDLVTDNCDLNASGGSDAEITVNKELTVDASGGSDVSYKGTGVIRNVKSSGSSSVKKRS